MPSSSTARFSPARVRSILNRSPLFTRVILIAVIILWFTSLAFPKLPHSGALIPSEITLIATYRLNTYPLVHSGFLQALFSIIALVPLLERFEAEHGTLVSVALFIGPFATFPGLLYIFFDHVIFRSNDTVLGASVWVFLLLACETVKQYKTNPWFDIGPYRIPTWTFALIAILLINFLIPNTSLLAHLCGCTIGYGFELGLLKFLVPPERILRWIEARLNLLGRLPKYVSVDQKTYGRYGVLDSRAEEGTSGVSSARNFVMGSN